MSSTKITLKKRRQRSVTITAVIMLTPFFFFMLWYIVYSIFDSVKMSLFQWNGIDAIKTFVGLGNWINLIRDQKFWLSLVNNLKIVVLSILIQLPIGMALAYLLDWGGRKLNFLKVIYFLPLLMSSVAIGFLFKYIYDPVFGLITPLVHLFGEKGTIDLLGNPHLAIYAIILVICWQFIPFYMVYFLAGLSSLPEEIYEAAIIDGAGRTRYFFSFVIPMLRGTINAAIVLSIVGSLKYFDLIYVMTGGGPSGSTELMATYMYKNAFTTMRIGYGSAIATAMFIVITAVSLITMRVIREKEEV
jgi:ABC-type sugar transport system permease subunit